MKEISSGFFVVCAADVVHVIGNVRLDLSSCCFQSLW